MTQEPMTWRDWLIAGLLLLVIFASCVVGHSIVSAGIY